MVGMKNDMFDIRGHSDTFPPITPGQVTLSWLYFWSSMTAIDMHLLVGTLANVIGHVKKGE